MNLSKLDAIFSKFIRLRDSDERGICKCITCGTYYHWTKCDNGHHVKRQHMATRFSEINCNAQCRKCNWLGQGEDVKYRNALINKYGIKIYEQLMIQKTQQVKYTQFEIDVMTDHYMDQVKKLLKLKS
jgi:hypothetical protein